VGGQSGDVALNAHEKEALIALVTELIEANQPKAVLAVLQRIAERMTMRAIRYDRRADAAGWMKLVDALETVNRA
jgi:hypothetical protein